MLLKTQLNTYFLHFVKNNSKLVFLFNLIEVFLLIILQNLS